MRESRITNKPPVVEIHQNGTPRDFRKELWIGIAVAVARAENATGKQSPALWANTALLEFDKTFGANKP